MSTQLNVLTPGRMPYEEAWELQRQLHGKRLVGEIPDSLILLEHPPVYTFGKNADQANLLDSRDAEVIQSDRGGDITWHGPGQLVGYPILNLEDHRKSVSWYMRSLEEVIVQALTVYGIRGERIAGMTGVWIGNEKICAMGVRLSRWVTMHGFALNVDPDMTYFQGMIPCGIREKGVTSLSRLLNRKLALDEVIPGILDAFQAVFGFSEIRPVKGVQPVE